MPSTSITSLAAGLPLQNKRVAEDALTFGGDPPMYEAMAGRLGITVEECAELRCETAELLLLKAKSLGDDVVWEMVVEFCDKSLASSFTVPPHVFEFHLRLNVAVTQNFTGRDREMLEYHFDYFRKHGNSNISAGARHFGLPYTTYNDRLLGRLLRQLSAILSQDSFFDEWVADEFE